MPTVLRLRLIPQDDVCLYLDHPPAQAWFLALAAQYDRVWEAPGAPDGAGGWAASLHAPNERHPYAVSPLYHAGRTPLWEDDAVRPWLTPDGGRPGPHRPQSRRADIARPLQARNPWGRPLALRVSLADDERARNLLAALPHLALPPLGRVPCALERFPVLTPTDPDVLYASWARLADAPAAERLRVTFETPTAAGHDGASRGQLQAAHLLKSWGGAWQWAPPEARAAALGGLEGLTADGLVLHSQGLARESLPTKGGLRSGFVGEMEIGFRPGTPAAVRRAVTALASVADFFGTGAKAALGMGQTRVRLWE